MRNFTIPESRQGLRGGDEARLQFLVDHHGAGLLTGEVGAGKSTAARTFTAGLNPNLYKILYLHWTSGSALDLLRQLALQLDLGAGALSRRSGPPDLGSHRASQQEQEAASHSHLRRSPTAAAPRSGAV